MPVPSLAARLLQPVSWLYGALAAVHRWPFRCGLRTVLPAPRPTIVVGNIVAGGAGKTPAVMALVRWLQAEGRVPGVVSRGHGRATDELIDVHATTAASAAGDEPLLIHRRTGVPVLVGRDRAAAAARLCAAHPEVDVIVADDGLQHLALARDIEVLVFDERGAGNGLLLPAGLLREPLPRTLGPRQLVLYNAARPSTPLQGHLGLRRLGGVVALQDWWRGGPLAVQPLSVLTGRNVLAAAGLARPNAFFDMLDAAGVAIRRLPLPDHHDFASLPWSDDEADVVVTEKDAVKLPPSRAGTTRVWVATLDFEPEPAFGDALRRLMNPTPP
nr:tetraacyldisaccharide 4'-kinase [Ideonella sp. A 288]